MPTFTALAELVCYTGLAVAGLCQCLQWLGAGRGRVVEPELPWGIPIEE